MKGRPFRSWFRVVFVPDWLLWVGLFAVLAVWFIAWSLRLIALWMAHTYWPNLTEQELQGSEVLPLHQGALVLLAFAYGGMRGLKFHPVLVRRYGTWLAQTPWEPSKPLPCGPVQLVWQDAAVLAALLALSLLPPLQGFHPLYLLVAFLATYCAVSAYAHVRVGIWSTALWFVASFALGILFFDIPIACLLIALALYSFTQFGSRRSLQRFPYSSEERESLGITGYEKLPPPVIALPILPSRLDKWRYFVGRSDAALVAGTVVGILMFCLFYHSSYDPEYVTGLVATHAIAAAILIVVRLVVYCAGARPPISLLGRLATKRLFIPGYDVVFVAPLLVGLAAYVVPLLLLGVGVKPLIAVPIASAVCVSLTIALPPDLETWNYTGHFRIPSTRVSRTELV